VQQDQVHQWVWNKMEEANQKQKMEEKTKQAEKEIVEEAVEKVEEKKETVVEAEKEIAKEIAKEKPAEDTKKQESEKEQDTEKKETKKEEKSTVPKKNEAVVNGMNLSISTKHSIAICNFIRGKYIDLVIKGLEEVVDKKRAIRMKGEIPHRKGKRMMSGRYPVKASKEFIKLLKSLKANAIVNELELEKYEIFCKANVAPRPYKSFGQGRFKRTHVTLKLIPLKKRIKKSKNKGGEK